MVVNTCFCNQFCLIKLLNSDLNGFQGSTTVFHCIARHHMLNKTVEMTSGLIQAHNR